MSRKAERPVVDFDDESPKKGRSFWEPIILSTLPHFLALIFVVCPEDQSWILISYAIITFLSSTLSVVWHLLGERKDWTMYADYTLAFLWTAIEIVAAFARTCPVPIVLILFLNITVLAVNKIVDHLGAKGIASYDEMHSYWHVLSAFKATATAYLIGCRWNEATCPVVQ